MVVIEPAILFHNTLSTRPPASLLTLALLVFMTPNLNTSFRFSCFTTFTPRGFSLFVIVPCINSNPLILELLLTNNKRIHLTWRCFVVPSLQKMNYIRWQLQSLANVYMYLVYHIQFILHLDGLEPCRWIAHCHSDNLCDLLELSLLSLFWVVLWFVRFLRTINVEPSTQPARMELEKLCLILNISCAGPPIFLTSEVF